MGGHRRKRRKMGGGANNAGKEKKTVKFAPNIEMTQSNIKGLMLLANPVKENHKNRMGKTKEKTYKQNNIKMDILDDMDQTAEMYLTTKEQMKMFDWLAEAFSYEEQTELELDLRSVIHQRQEEPDAKINA